MLKKKIERSGAFLAKEADWFCCPHCQAEMMFQAPRSLVCRHGHQFDLSKKGTLYFPSHQIKSDYDKEMLAARGRMIRSGLYQQVLEEMGQIIPSETKRVLDAGCGEGSFLSELQRLGVKGSAAGFDLSKDGIELATNQAAEAFWCVADMTNLPFQKESTDVICNIFSPAHYGEFRRILRPAGLVVKVVPEAGYLQELRALFYAGETKETYSNDQVVTKFKDELTLLDARRCTYVASIAPNCQDDLLKMSPLHWSASKEAKERARSQKISNITIDVTILTGKK